MSTGKKTKYFYDCEFLEDGYTVDLISIGMVSEDGREYYAVSSEFDTGRVVYNDWLMENVMTSISHKIETKYLTSQGLPMRDLILTDPYCRTRREIRDDIFNFTDNTRPEFWAWYSAYDHVALCQLFGRMIDLPKRFHCLLMISSNFIRLPVVLKCLNNLQENTML